MEPASPVGGSRAEPTLTRHNWFLPSNLRLALRSGTALAPFATIARGEVGTIPFIPGPPLDLDALTFDPGTGPTSAAGYLDAIHTDGLIVLHRGRLIAERYFGGMTAERPHQWASLTKSVTGLVAVILADAGAIDLDRPAAGYVPELADTPFGTATVQQNLDMEVAADWPAGMSELDWLVAAGLAPGMNGSATGVRAFVRTKAKRCDRPHGSCFFYNNPAAETVAWVAERATGTPWPTLASDLVWSRIGAAADAAVLLDPAGDPIASGGMISTLADLARLAEAVRAGGVVNGRQALPASAIERLLTPAENADRFAAGNIVGGRAGFGYRNGWYHANDADGTILASGRFGQRAVVNRRAELTIVQFSGHPGRSEETAAGFAALVRAIADRS